MALSVNGRQKVKTFLALVFSLIFCLAVVGCVQLDNFAQQLKNIGNSSFQNQHGEQIITPCDPNLTSIDLNSTTLPCNNPLEYAIVRYLIIRTDGKLNIEPQPWDDMESVVVLFLSTGTDRTILTVDFEAECSPNIPFGFIEAKHEQILDSNGRTIPLNKRAPAQKFNIDPVTAAYWSDILRAYPKIYAHGGCSN